MDALSMLLENVHLCETKYYRLQGAGNWSYSITRQDTILFYLVVSGSFCIDVNGSLRQAHAGDMIMIPNTYQHVSYAVDHHGDNAKALDDKLLNCKEHAIRLHDDDDLSESNLCLILIECQYDKEMIRPLLSVLPSVLPEIQELPESRSEFIEVVIKLLALESEYERMGKTAVINHWASIMMIECLRTYIERLPEATDSWLQAMKDPYLAKALMVMHDVPNQNWTINQLAEVAGMSRSSFAQRFKDTVGMPPLTYLIDYRLRLAARYLRLQQNSIGRISELVGYASDSTFSQAFKRVYGVSPKAYRQQYRKTEGLVIACR
ncbi:AraC family transcriptional regulator [Psychrobacter frigidicola]|uniref:AraC family transcriptional regulator n=1 Tax=Psychrobacter frigidicola TaxID=45611 RepID=A0A5C7A0S8_9GAMM|nr:AraC family transcriptional regulator [Psychrobacter frigidicola]TXD97004.1 AraC family transcriptional regulator [Psychrobacter frigidicola]